jgi:exopolyphosphatase / guanosine-5'-triphosphate,3'-diphosphate pyrophosphatase
MTISSIDIGTNTILLLLAEVDILTKKIKPILNEHRIPRIGKGLKPRHPISEIKINELFNVLEEYKKIIDMHKCEVNLVTATNAFRIASNSKELVKEIQHRFSLNVEIVKGEEEAKLSYLGASSNINVGKTLVIDIGGGSTEIIYGIGNELKFIKSFQVGVVSGSEMFLHNDPPKRNEINKLNYFIIKELEEICKQNISPDNTIAIAGTPTTLACIKNNLIEYNEEVIEGSYLYINEMKDIIKKICTLSIKQISEKFNVVAKGREDVLLAGSYILFNIMKLLEIDRIIVSTKGIRYGAIVNYLQNI